MERLLDVLQHGTALVDDDGDDVETDVHIEIVPENITLRGKNEIALFPEVHSGAWLAVGIARTGLYLNDHKLVPVTCDDVHFVMPEVPVAFEDLITLFHKEFNGKVLAPPSQTLIIFHFKNV
jgi:hypothetical protein